MANNEIPRRIRQDLWCPAEKAIATAMAAVEAMAPDLRLTAAVMLLGQARERVADFVDGVEYFPCARCGAQTTLRKVNDGCELHFRSCTTCHTDVQIPVEG